ncbi:spore germination protein [Bacillus infantis]|uniref:Spore germination protein n=1 Tax=Bacillus infantis TaxID=324767 RepID=A0A5D4RR50_9BACI|nr:spore germination protein [Bacillus infantis]TYS52194.1 spore germination protein [Bacillus infantis]
MQGQSLFSSDCEKNMKWLESQLGCSSDIRIRRIKPVHIQMEMILAYIDGIVDAEKIEEQIISPLLGAGKEDPSQEMPPIPLLVSSILHSGHIKELDEPSKALKEMLDGNSVLFIDGWDKAYALESSKWPERSPAEPQAQRTPIGPSIAFNESLTNNLALIRKILKSPDLRIDKGPFNSKIVTQLSLIYVEGKADKEILDSVRQSLSKIEIPFILDINYLEEALTEGTKTFFPLTLSTDRPDVVCAEVMEGRIAIAVDGTPFVTTLPAVLVQFFQSPDDYYTLNRGVQIRRLARIFFFMLSVLLPALYISFTVYHPGLVPTQLLIGIIAQREYVPLPTILEVLIFYWLILIISEGSLRLPQGVVLTVTIFASITLGQQAVEAQLVQPTSLVILSAAYVMASISPIYSLVTAQRRLTFRFILLSSFLGLFGVIVGFLALLLHLCSLRSFMVPYLSPLAPFNLSDQKDALFRVPIPEIVKTEKKFTKEEKMKRK